MASSEQAANHSLGTIKWPLYVLVAGEASGLPVRCSSVLLITASFAFARSLNARVEDSLGEACSIIRVTSYNRCLLVKSLANSAVRSMDTLHPQPPPVTVRTYCITCVKALSAPITGDSWFLIGLSAAPEPATPCSAHQRDWVPQYRHQRVQLNTLNADSATACSAVVEAAFRRTKLAWAGCNYFVRAMRSRLPAEVIENILLLMDRPQYM